jgi:hypothetical protein
VAFELGGESGSRGAGHQGDAGRRIGYTASCSLTGTSYARRSRISVVVGRANVPLLKGDVAAHEDPTVAEDEVEMEVLRRVLGVGSADAEVKAGEALVDSWSLHVRPWLMARVGGLHRG